MASWTSSSLLPELEKQEALILGLTPTQAPFGLVNRPQRTGSCPQTKDTISWISCPGPGVLGVPLSQLPPDLAIRPQKTRSYLQTTAIANWTPWYSTPRQEAPECLLKSTPQ